MPDQNASVKLPTEKGNTQQEFYQMILPQIFRGTAPGASQHSDVAALCKNIKALLNNHQDSYQNSTVFYYLAPKPPTLTLIYFFQSPTNAYWKALKLIKMTALIKGHSLPHKSIRNNNQMMLITHKSNHFTLT